MITRFVDWLIARAKRTPYSHLPGYMLRWWLVPYGTGPFGVSARIHEILRSDDDRHFHDHPWWYVTIILRGGYWEVTPAIIELWRGHWVNIGVVKREWRGPGTVLFRRAKTWHRLEIPEGQTCTTLFITGPYSNAWGFLVDGEKVHHDDYLGGLSDAA